MYYTVQIDIGKLAKSKVSKCVKTESAYRIFEW